jgi:hypothetical protein
VLPHQYLAAGVRAATGAVVQVEVAGGTVVPGTITRAGTEWVLLTGAGPDAAEWLVRLPAVRVVRGLSRLAAAEPVDVIESRLGIGRLLRALARDRAPVTAFLADGASLHGTIDRVGADFLDMAVHAAGEARRRRAVLDVRLVALTHLAALRRHDAGAAG